MDTYAAQWIGKRQNQEDSYGVKHFPNGTLAVVCDGMGGHDCGDMASKLSVDAFIKSFKILPGVSAVESLKTSLDYANEMVKQFFSGKEQFGGTTLLAIFVSPTSLWWVSVGDSPLFIWRSGRLVRLNEDHSMRSLIDDIICGPSRYALANNNHGHILRSALTGATIAMIDAPQRGYPLLPRDRIILSSDGSLDFLSQYGKSPRLSMMMDRHDGSLAGCIVDACRELDVEHADNVTVLTIDA